MILEQSGGPAPERRPEVFFVSADAEGAAAALRRGAELRKAGIACDLDPRGGKLEAQFKQAERVGARYARRPRRERGPRGRGEAEGPRDAGGDAGGAGAARDAAAASLNRGRPRGRRRARMTPCACDASRPSR